jgi:hypothetical protein
MSRPLPSSSPVNRLQTVHKHFSTTRTIKMPQTNNEDFLLSNVFDVKGKVGDFEMTIGST